MLKRKTRIKGHATGIDQIDQSFGGLKDRELYCFCYTPHVNNHNLLAKVIVGLASRKLSVVVFTLDCTHRDMYERLIKVIQKYDTSLSMNNSFLHRSEATEKFGSYAIWIQEVPALNYETLNDRLQSLYYLNRHAVECVIIDNILKMETNFQTPSKEMTLEANLYLLKMLGKEYKIPIIFSMTYDKTYLDKIQETNHISKTVLFKTTDDNIDNAQNTPFPTITIPRFNLASNLSESSWSIVIA